MASGMRTFVVVLFLGQAAVLWWMSGQYAPTGGSAGEPKPTVEPRCVWSSESPAGKFWGNESRQVISLDGDGVAGKGKAITISLQGDGWRGCGLNWKGWFPADAGDDVSKFRSLTLHIRQVTQIADADLTIHLVDNMQRPDRRPASNGLSILKDGGLSRIDGEWRRVVLPLQLFARNNELDLKRIWGVDFSDASGRALVFQVDSIGFSDDLPPPPKFPPSPGYSAAATVHIDRPGHAIRDEIYGVCEMPADKVAQYSLPIVRWGGNRSSRFNWKINADSAGKDWFFKNGGVRVADPADGGWVQFLRKNHEAGATGYLTVPMLGFVAKDHESYAFSVKKYGQQQETEPDHADVGNGLAPGGRPLTADWRDTSIAADPEFIAEGVRLAVRHAKPGTRYWVLDNEPMLWHETHRDVRRQPLGYEELWERTVQYAEAIKRADPHAKVAGFCSWGWTDLYYSAADEGGNGYRTRPDHQAHGNVPLAEWFIKKCGDYKRQHGKVLVDVFDFHWYPQAELNGRSPYQGTGPDPKFNQLRLRTTRDLWDPTYQQESWIRDANPGQATMVLRRVRAWIEKHNPEMEICLGEYNFGGADNISGALAQADVFGILARERADLAFIWTRPEGTQELAWKLFRNYDGAGSRFGDKYVPCESSHGDLAVYAAKRAKDGATTIAVINKNLGSQCTLKLNVPGLRGSMQVWRFDQETGGRVVHLSADSRDVNGEVTLTIPAASGTMIVIK
jgi:hypothetical protein